MEEHLIRLIWKWTEPYFLRLISIRMHFLPCSCQRLQKDYYSETLCWVPQFTWSSSKRGKNKFSLILHICLSVLFHLLFSAQSPNLRFRPFSLTFIWSTTWSLSSFLSRLYLLNHILTVPNKLSCFSLLKASHAQSVYNQTHLVGLTVVLIYMFVRTGNTAPLCTHNTWVLLLLTSVTLLLSHQVSFTYSQVGFYSFSLSVSKHNCIFISCIWHFFHRLFFTVLETLGHNCACFGNESHEIHFFTSVLKNLSV